MDTIIIGGGIIGTSIAYYLSEVSNDPSSIHIFDSSSKLFASASGYAAGFLAKDWFSPAAAELGVLSFELHKELAEKHNGSQNWGYTPSTALSLAIQEGVGVGTGERGEDWLLEGTSRAEVVAGNDRPKQDWAPAWLTEQRGGALHMISGDEGCAQLDPLRLCEFLMGACQARGVQVHYPARVISLKRDRDGTIIGAKFVSDGYSVPSEIACKNVVIASGAWTPAVFRELFPDSTISIPISPLAGYSLVVRSPRHTLVDEEKYGRSHAIFSAPTKNYAWAPEIFSRNGGEIYIAGLNDPTLSLPVHAAGAVIEDGAMVELKRAAVQLMGHATHEGDEIRENDLQVIRETLCFRPVVERGRGTTPIISKVQDSVLGKGTKHPKGGGIFIAAGHGPWGISLSLGSGKVVSQMICGEETDANISRLGV